VNEEMKKVMARYEKLNDKLKSRLSFDVGDKVWKRTVSKPNVNRKLFHPFDGPFIVSEKRNDLLYKIHREGDDPSKGELVNVENSSLLSQESNLQMHRESCLQLINNKMQLLQLMSLNLCFSLTVMLFGFSAVTASAAVQLCIVMDRLRFCSSHHAMAIIISKKCVNPNIA